MAAIRAHLRRTSQRTSTPSHSDESDRTLSRSAPRQKKKKKTSERANCRPRRARNRIPACQLTCHHHSPGHKKRDAACQVCGRVCVVRACVRQERACNRVPPPQPFASSISKSYSSPLSVSCRKFSQSPFSLVSMAHECWRSIFWVSASSARRRMTARSVGTPNCSS